MPDAPAVIDAPAPAAATAPEPAEDLGDPFSAYSAPAEPAEKPAAPSTDGKPVPAPTKPAETTPGAPKLEDATSPERMAPKALREAYAASKAKMAALEKERDELKARPQPRWEDDPGLKARIEKADAAAKRAEELENEIRYLEYERSGEYQDKFHKPYVETWQNAVGSVGEIRITNSDGSVRQATAEDLLAVVQAGNTEDALETAERIFGTPTKANYVMGLRKEIIQQHLAAEKAKAEFKTNGAERMRQQQEQKAQQFGQQASRFKQLAQEAIDKFPQWFKPDDTDARGKELLAKGMQMADEAFSGKLPPEKAIPLHAAIRNKAGAFDFLVHKSRGLTQRVQELEAELAEFKKSTPGAGEVGGEGKAGEDELGDPFAKFH